MKKELQYIIYAHIVLVVFLIYETFDLITLLNDDTGNFAFSPLELYNSTTDYEVPSTPLLDSIDSLRSGEGSANSTLIPKIIHQTYKTADIPEEWKAGQELCINLHPDYQYILWTDEMSRDFIAENYPWFLETFDSYKYPIQRADAIRYFVLYTYGGIYIDLDDGCNRRLDPLLNSALFLRKTIPTGISNDVMGSIPHHPFFGKVINDISRYNHDWIIPYITIMYSTGPLFLSVMWKQYKRWGNNSLEDLDTVRVLMTEDYKLNADSFFNISKGSSWHTDDLKFMFQLLHHLPLLIIGGFLIAFSILLMEFLIYKLVCVIRFNNLLNLLLMRSRLGDDKNGSGEDDAFDTDEIIHLHLKRADYIKRNRKDSNLPVKIYWEKGTEMV